MANQTPVHVAIVDAFSSTQFLTQALRKARIKTSVIYTVDEVSGGYCSLQPELFDQAFYIKDKTDFTKLISELKTANVNRVYYGSEDSVEITDNIANAICPEFANDISTAAARWDKYEMQEALRKAGIPCVKQIKVINQLTPTQEQALSHWDFPVIIKPNNMYGAIGVEVCNTVNAIKDYLQRYMTTNIFGQAIDHFVIQEFLVGDEFLIDSFSLHGKHFINGVQRYQRTIIQNSPVCLYAESISSDSDEAQQSMQYVKHVLTAVGLKNGFGHTELMLTEKGPYLIEINPRVSGAYGFHQKLFQSCGFNTQIDYLIASCQSENMPESNNTRYGRNVYLYNFKERAINELNMMLLQSLPSFKEAIMIKAPATIVSTPRTLTDAVGFALLIHNDRRQVEVDFEQLFLWEKNLELF